MEIGMWVPRTEKALITKLTYRLISRLKALLLVSMLLTLTFSVLQPIPLVHAQVHTREFPEDSTGYNGHIADTGTHLADTGTSSVDTGTEPAAGGSHITDTGTHSLQATGLSSEGVPSFVNWVSKANGPANSLDAALAIAISPDGSRVYVTGQSFGSGTGIDYLTVAYNTADGSVAWARRYNGPVSSTDDARGIAISPDGSTVYVTGASRGSRTGSADVLTIAYNAADGSVA